MGDIRIFEVTYRLAAKQALQVQDACNLSGVVLSFASAVLAVKEEARKQGKGGEWVSSHPIVFLFQDKTADLIGRSHFEDGDRFHAAVEQCRRIAGIEGEHFQ